MRRVDRKRLGAARADDHEIADTNGDEDAGPIANATGGDADMDADGPLGNTYTIIEPVCDGACLAVLYGNSVSPLGDAFSATVRIRHSSGDRHDYPDLNPIERAVALAFHKSVADTIAANLRPDPIAVDPGRAGDRTGGSGRGGAEE